MINNLSSFGNWQQGGGIQGQRPPFPPPHHHRHGQGQGVENSQQLPPPPPPEVLQQMLQQQQCQGGGQCNSMESLLNQFGSQSYLGQTSNTLGNFLQF